MASANESERVRVVTYLETVLNCAVAEAESWEEVDAVISDDGYTWQAVMLGASLIEARPGFSHVGVRVMPIEAGEKMPGRSSMANRF